MADQFDGEKATTLVMDEAAPMLSASEFAWLRRQVESDASVPVSRSKYIQHQGKRERMRRQRAAV